MLPTESAARIPCEQRHELPNAFTYRPVAGQMVGCYVERTIREHVYCDRTHRLGVRFRQALPYGQMNQGPPIDRQNQEGVLHGVAWSEENFD